MTGPLCPVSPSDPRPTLFDSETIHQTVLHNAAAIYAWSKLARYPEDEAWVIAAVTEAFQEAQGEAARAARIMEIHHRWRADSDIRWHLSVIEKNLPKMLVLRIGAWVLRTGMRFPGKPGDLIEFIDTTYRHSARVVKLNPCYASAEIETEGGIIGSIYAEQVYANKTNEREGARLTVGFSLLPNPLVMDEIA